MPQDSAFHENAQQETVQAPAPASRNQLKILVLFSHVWRGGRAGGAETHALQLMKELSLRGHEIYFVASSGRSEEDSMPPGVAAEYRLPFQSLNPFDKVRSYRRLKEIVTDRKSVV